MPHVKIVYRLIKTKQFIGKNSEEKAKKFCEELKKNDMAEDINIFAVDSSGGTQGYWELDNWKYYGDMG